MNSTSETSLKNNEYLIVSFTDPVIISEFLVAVGDPVWDDQPMFVDERGVMFLSSEYGTVTDIYVSAGQMIPAGTDILKIKVGPARFPHNL